MEINNNQEVTVIQIEQDSSVDHPNKNQEPLVGQLNPGFIVDQSNPKVTVVQTEQNSLVDQPNKNQESSVDESNENHELPVDDPNPESIVEQPNQNQEAKRFVDKCSQWIRNYLNKFAGLNEKRPPRIHWHEYIWSFIGSFISILFITLLHYRILSKRDLVYVIGSFGASAVLIYGAPRSPFSQPRNLMGGHLITALCGCVVRVAIDRYEHAVACALAVGIAIFMMQLTETTHPPGGATALLAVTTQPTLPWAHFLFIFMPVLTGALTMLIVALVVNNLAPKRSYPTFWW